MYNWITLLDTWNSHNIVNQLYSNKIFLNMLSKRNQMWKLHIVYDSIFMKCSENTNL